MKTIVEEEEAPESSSLPHLALFPPALIPILRHRLGDAHPSLSSVSDQVLAELLTVAFFAGLETHEGSHHQVKIAFVGVQTEDIVLPHGHAPLAKPMLRYRWSSLRLDEPRPYAVRELVKLAVVTRSSKMFLRVELAGRGLRIAGLAREGENAENDPYLKVVSPRPGVLTLRSGDEALFEYEQGRIVSGTEDVITGPGFVRRTLEGAARSAHLGEAALFDYLGTVKALVREMASHQKGGILVVSGETQPELPLNSSYRTQNDSAMTQLLPYLDGAVGTRRAGSAAPRRDLAVGELKQVLRNAFLAEAKRCISEFGAFTAMDGATILSCGLGLRGFGVVLPVSRSVEVVEALDSEAVEWKPFNLSTRGTRHCAAAAYAKQHPGAVVFIASQDGPMGCMVREIGGERVLVWRLGPGDML